MRHSRRGLRALRGLICHGRDVQLAIDAADDAPAVALAVDGVAGMVLAWESARNHSVELLPNIDRLLSEAGRSKDDIDAICVDIGPGGYAALRVGVSIAKALAHGLDVPIAGVGRLELDAWSVQADAGDARIIAVHRAGRGEAAWATYRNSPDGWMEMAPPRISPFGDLHAAILRADVVVGDIDDDLAVAVRGAGAAVASPHTHRVIALAALGQERLASGRTDAAETLVPLYLRAPAIGAQP